MINILDPLIIVPKQNSTTEKARETTVESVEIVSARLHRQTASITPVARIRINSLRIIDIKPDLGFRNSKMLICRLG